MCVCVGECHIIEEGLHGSRGGRSAWGGLCQEDVIMTALAPLESRHPRLGQSLWWLWVMRPRCVCLWGGVGGAVLHEGGRGLCPSRPGA